MKSTDEINGMCQDLNGASSEELELTNLYEKAPIGLCVTDTQHRYVRINKQLCEINGRSIEEHIGRTIHEVIPHIADQIVPMFQGVIDSAEPVLSHEVRGHTAAHPDEERIFMSDHYPLLSSTGRVLYVHTIVRDITLQGRAEAVLKESNEELEARVGKRTAELESLTAKLEAEVEDRRRAEEVARAGEERLRLLLESTRIIPWEADARTWKFTYVGPQATLLGYPADRWFEPDFWSNHLHPEDREEAVNFRTSKSRQGENYEFEYRMISSDGQEIWVHDLFSVEMSCGESVLLRGFMIDITDQKRAQIELRKNEEAIRCLMEASPDGVVIVGQRGVILHTNEQMCRIFGYADKKLLGIPIDQLVPDDSRGTHREQRDIYFQSPSARPMGALANLHGQRKDGSLFPVDVCISPITLEGRNVTACFVRDITRQKGIEDEGRRHLAELAHVSRVTAMGELVGSMGLAC